MKFILKVFLYLNIYTLISNTVFGQTLYLEIATENEMTTTLIDSIQLPTSFENYMALEKMTQELYQTFQKKGFLEAERKSVSKKNDTTYTAEYYLGNRWKELVIYFEPGTLDKRLVEKITRKSTDTTLTIAIENLETTLSEINTWKASNGDPFSKLSLSQIQKKDNQTLLAQLKLEISKTRIIDGVIVKGYEKFPKSYLKYYAGIKKGKTFNLKKIEEQNQLLNNLGFVNTIKPPEALFKKDSTIIYFYLKKTNHNLFDGILGFATNEETQRLQFNGYLNLELNNNLNFGEQLLINYKADGNEQQNFKTRLTLPYLLKSPFGVSLELSIFKRDSTFSTTEQLAKLLYQPSPKIQVHLGYKSQESNNLLNELIVGNTVLDLKANYIVSGLNYTQQQNNNLFPTKTFVSINTELGNRELPEIDDEQIRLLFNAHHIFNLNTRNSIYLNNNTQFLSSDTYVTNELFRFGGINSIRGFNENSIDASLYTVINTEYRYLLNADSFVHSIIDLGYFENEVQNISQELYSFGIGIGLTTKAGLLRLNIANGTSKGEAFQFNNTKVHISLNALF